MREEWADIDGYNGDYKISNFGNVKSFKGTTPKLLSLEKRKDGYLKVRLYENNVAKNIMVHRLVGIKFVANHNNLKTLNHKDGNKTNNYHLNLEWCTQKANVQHAWEIGLANADHFNKPVHQFNLAGMYIKTYPSIKEAAQNNGMVRTHIGRVCEGERKTAGGFVWGFVNERKRISEKSN